MFCFPGPSLFPIVDLRSFPLNLYNAEYLVLDFLVILQVIPLIDGHCIHTSMFFLALLGIKVAVQYKHNHVQLMVSYNDRKRSIIKYEYVRSEEHTSELQS